MSSREFVTRVIDGDTFKTAERTKRIRLANVDAPELGEKGGLAAKSALESLIDGEWVTIETVAHDDFGRPVAYVRIGMRSVNDLMNDKLNRM